MNDLDLDKIREMLEYEREHLLQGTRDQADSIGDSNPDEMDLADLSADQEVKVSLDQLSIEILERIENALNRLDAGTYGKCQNCGKEIHAGRLLALPYAELCVKCQAKQEERSTWASA